MSTPQKQTPAPVDQNQPRTNQPMRGFGNKPAMAEDHKLPTPRKGANHHQ